jgi:hypothetical protein
MKEQRQAMASWKLIPRTRMKKSMALPARLRSGQRQYLSLRMPGSTVRRAAAG